MATPLSPTATSTLNITTPSTTRRYETSSYKVKSYTKSSSSSGDGGSGSGWGVDDESVGSSPFVSTVNDTTAQENIDMSASKNRHSRVLSGTELSPLKILAENRSSIDAAATMSPRRAISPIKRFPVKVSNPMETPRPASRTPEQEISIVEAIRENEGLKKAIEIFEDEESVLDQGHDGHDQYDEHDEMAGPDDTMVSTFSTFSAVPNMTMFARLGHSPSKFSNAGGMTPRAKPGPSPDRTPRAVPAVQQESGNTTNLLMDFTDQLRIPHKSPPKRGNLPSSRTTPNVAAVPSTPARSYQNLIDFEIPPMPTPRSIPSITPRELESLKSNFLSEISSLKASLSGKEAEVLSLKSAVGDAEKRVGESMEQLREERSLKEQLSAEKDSWEKRGREMETVLRSVKEEIVHSQRDREELESKLDESEKRREAAEIMAQDAESKMAGMKAGKAAEEKEANSPDKFKSSGGSSSAKEVEIAVERVARELHALYKSKHETKVAALKKSYENRWEKKVRELEAKIEELADDNEKLKVGRDATMTRVDPAAAALEEERKEQAVRDQAQIKELEAEVEKLEAVVKTVKGDNSELRKLLESERVEKGELVQLAEELMSMQQTFVASEPASQSTTTTATTTPSGLRTPAHTRTQQVVENLRGSISRGSGLRAPGSVAASESRIGKASHERTRSAGVSGLQRPGSIGPRSGIMSSIERMGNYRGRGD